MVCSRCGKQLAEDQRYLYQGKVMCEDCVMDLGLSLKECDPWASYVDTSDRKRHGATGPAGLNELETKVFDFVKAKGKVTRRELMESLDISDADLSAQLVTLMHDELVKEMGESGERYLVLVPVPRD